MKEFLIHAKYCEGPFYMGWWLYTDPIVNGKALYSKSFNEGHWHRNLGESPGTGEILQVVTKHGHDLPKPRRHNDAFAEAFSLAFPHGIRLSGENWRKLDLETSTIQLFSLTADWPYGDRQGSHPTTEVDV